MSALTWILSKVGHRDNEKFNAMVETIAQEHGVSRGRVVRDMYKNALTRGAGFTDYFRGEYFGASAEQKDTYVTTKSFYKLLEYLNDEGYANVMRNKILFCDVFRPYLGREFINLRAASVDEFASFLEGKDVVFAKHESGFGGHGVSKVEVADHSEEGVRRLYDELRAEGQILVEETIVQHDAVNEINPHVVASFRVVTLVDGKGEAHLIANSMRINRTTSAIIGCADDVYFSLNAEGTLSSHAIDDYGRIYDKHPITGKPFAEVCIPGVGEAFELCLRAALEVPQVRYVGWDIAFSDHGPILLEGNAYPGYGLFQYNKMTGRTTGHLADIAAVLGDEMSKIKL